MITLKITPLQASKLRVILVQEEARMQSLIRSTQHAPIRQAAQESLKVVMELHEQVRRAS